MTYPLMTRIDRAQRAKRVATRYAEGVHPEDVASEFGLSRAYVNRLAYIYGVSRPKGRPRKEAQ